MGRTRGGSRTSRRDFGTELADAHHVGRSYDWSKDHVHVKSTLDLSDGRLTLVEDRLKPGFSLATTTAR